MPEGLTSNNTRVNSDSCCINATSYGHIHLAIQTHANNTKRAPLSLSLSLVSLSISGSACRDVAIQHWAHKLQLQLLHDGRSLDAVSGILLTIKYVLNLHLCLYRALTPERCVASCPR